MCEHYRLFAEPIVGCEGWRIPGINFCVESTTERDLFPTIAPIESSPISSAPTSGREVTSEEPTQHVSDEPSLLPPDVPSTIPSSILSNDPSSRPSDMLSTIPSTIPTVLASDKPSQIPSEYPTTSVDDELFEYRSQSPSHGLPFIEISIAPSDLPSDLPSSVPSDRPSTTPSDTVSISPSGFIESEVSLVPSTVDFSPSESSSPSMRDRLELEYIGLSPHGITPLDECQADCNSDLDCKPGLVCLRRTNDEAVPGCSGSPIRALDYCYRPPPGRLVIKTSGSSDESIRLGACEGHCENDGDCYMGLKCMDRTSFEYVPGCEGLGALGINYCYDPGKEIGISTSSPSPEPSFLMSSYPSTKTDSTRGDDVETQSPQDRDFLQPTTSPTTNVPTQVFWSSSTPTRVAFVLSANPTVAVSPKPFVRYNTLSYVGFPPFVTKLALCEGDCNSDDDCEDDLICFDRIGNEEVPGCIGNAISTVDYCVTKDAGLPTESPVRADRLSQPPSQTPSYLRSEPSFEPSQGDDLPFYRFDGFPPHERGTLDKCAGHCSADDDCGAGLLCYIRFGNERVPNCQGTPLFLVNYCFEPLPSNEPSEVPTQLPSQHPSMLGSDFPSDVPSAIESSTPSSLQPSQHPSMLSSDFPSDVPSAIESSTPSSLQTPPPSSLPSLDPTVLSSGSPSSVASSGKPLEWIPNGDGSVLGECIGDCNSDDDCENDLKCFQRSGNEEVPGCDISSGVFSVDYCYRPVKDEVYEEGTPSVAPSLNNNDRETIGAPNVGNPSSIHMTSSPSVDIQTTIPPSATDLSETPSVAKAGSEAPSITPTQLPTPQCEMPLEERAEYISDIAAALSEVSFIPADGSSIQSQALRWLLFDDAAQICPDDSSVGERYVLALLYFATSQSEWTHCGHLDVECATGSPFLSPNSVCDWSGVECSVDASVTALHLDNNNLDGYLPIEIGHLSALKEIDMDSNKLFGPLPSELGLLPMLEVIDLDNNLLIGSIPESLYSLTSLRVLDLDYNYLTGSISDDISALTSLFFIQLDFNDIEGTIPSELGSLSNLDYFSALSTRLVGTIPLEVCENVSHVFADCQLCVVEGCCEACLDEPRPT